MSIPDDILVKWINGACSVRDHRERHQSAMKALAADELSSAPEYMLDRLSEEQCMHWDVAAEMGIDNPAEKARQALAKARGES